MNKLIAIGMLFVGIFVSCNVSANELILKRPKKFKSGGCMMIVSIDEKEAVRLKNGEGTTLQIDKDQIELTAKWDCPIGGVNSREYNFIVKFDPDTNKKIIDFGVSGWGHHRIGASSAKVL